MGINKRIKIILGILIVDLALLSELFVFQFSNYSKASELKGFDKEKISLLRPDFRVKLLRYLENKDDDSLAYLKKQIDKFRSDKEILETMKNELQNIQSLIKNRDFMTALNLIITVKGQIKDINMFDTQELSKQIDSLRMEMYNEAKKE